MSQKLTIGGDEVRISELNGIKAVHAIRLVQTVMRLAPDLMKRRAAFVKQYRDQNVEVVARGEVKLRFPPIPVLDNQGDLARNQDGSVTTMPHPAATITDEEWQSMGNQLVLRQDPSDLEVGLEVLDDVMDRALEPFMRLMALAVATNGDVLAHKRDGDLDAWLDARGTELLERAGIDELMELVVTAVEVANGQVRNKLEQLGGRWGKALRVFGMDQAAKGSPPETPSTDSNGTSSTDSPGNTTGMSGKSSGPVGAPS